MDFKIRMRSQGDVLIWTLLIVDFAVIATTGYFRLFVPPALYDAVIDHAMAAAALIGAVLGYLARWQIMLGQSRHLELRRKNETDTLTGVHTRARFFSDATRVDIGRCAILMIDIDRFKSINDTYGHQTGDIVLAETSRRLASACRADDIVARYGGEEFIICLPLTSTTTAAACAGRLRLSVCATEISIAATSIPVSVSIGVANGRDGERMEDVIARADKALLVAKSSGRNRVVTEEALSTSDIQTPVVTARRLNRT